MDESQNTASLFNHGERTVAQKIIQTGGASYSYISKTSKQAHSELRLPFKLK